MAVSLQGRRHLMDHADDGLAPTALLDTFDMGGINHMPPAVRAATLYALTPHSAIDPEIRGERQCRFARSCTTSAAP